MKYMTLALLIAATLLTACKKEEVSIPTCENCNFTCVDTSDPDVTTNDCLDNWTCDFNLKPQSKVDIGEYDGLAEGGKNVFQMILRTEGSLQVADDELTVILVFELEPSQTSFSVEDSELEALNVYYRRVCFCLETAFVSINSGCMQGEQQSDGSWFVQGNLSVPYSFGDVDVMFDARFEKF